MPLPPEVVPPQCTPGTPSSSASGSRPPPKHVSREASTALSQQAQQQMQAIHGAAGLEIGEHDDPSRVLPKVSSLKFALTVCMLTAVAIMCICLLSDTFGTAGDVLDRLLQFGEVSWSVFAVFTFFAATLYVSDISYWQGQTGFVLRRVSLLGLVVGFMVVGLSLVREVPYFPLAICVFLLPLSGLAIRFTALRHNSAAGVSWVLGAGFSIASLVCLVVWLLWLGGAWDDDDQTWFNHRKKFSEIAHCNNSVAYGNKDAQGRTTVTTEDGEDVVICTAAFILWISPFILFGCLLFLGLFLFVLSRMLTVGGKKSTQSAIKMLCMTVFTAFFGMFSAVSVQGAGMELANVALCVFAVVLVGIVVVAGSTVGWDELSKKVHEMNALSKLGATAVTFCQAFAVCFGAAPFLAFLLMSFLNQQMRKLACGCGVCKELDDDERGAHLTTVARQKIAKMALWNWGKVLTYAYYLCLVAWVFTYFSKLTYIFFNWLVRSMGPTGWDLPFGAVVGIFIVIALLMFLIPVVPGPAVYLTAGVLVVPLGKTALIGGGGGYDACDDNSTPDDADLWAFWAAGGIASGLSFGLKLVAHVLQQKGIGETFRSRVSVRALVGPNSQQMRAARYILSQPGITAAKASLLCGGPDWPTSVICGLLGLDCCSMLIGLTPIIVFTTPGTMLGAFLTEPTYKEKNYDAICALVVLMVQLLMVVVFMSHINRVIATQQDVLNAYPLDEEVAQLDAKAARFAAVMEQVGNFNQAPLKVRRVFVSGISCAILSTYALLLAGSVLFQPFNITDCLDDLGMPRSDYVIWFLGMKPLGLVMILLMVYAHLSLKYFNSWAERQTKLRLAEDGASPEAPEAPDPPAPKAEDEMASHRC